LNDGFNSHGTVLTKKTTMRTSSRRTGRTCEKLPPNAIRKGPCRGRLSREEPGREFFGRHRSWAFWGWWMWFLFHFSDRHPKFRNIVAFPLAPVGFAQACQHRVAFVFDHDHQVVFVCLIARVFKKHPDGLVGTFGDEDRVARFDVDGLPRLVQIQTEGFLHNGSSY